MTTTRHTLQLTAGPLHADISEGAEAVRLDITGAVPMGFERNKVRRFLLPLILPFEADPRPLRIGGRGAGVAWKVQGVAGAGAVAWPTPLGAQ